MDIHILPVLLHFEFFWLPYLFFRYSYRYLIHTNYRWQQRGNVCYRDRRMFSITWAVVTGVLFELIVVHNVIKFHL